jgi:predicted transcriptional regulator
MAVQKLKRIIPKEMEKAYMYYALLSVVNSLSLSERELQLVSFAATKKHISYMEYKKEFCSLYGSSLPTVHNMISKLTRMGIFVRENKKVKVNPKIVLPFEEDIILQISLING